MQSQQSRNHWLIVFLAGLQFGCSTQVLANKNKPDLRLIFSHNREGSVDPCG